MVRNTKSGISYTFPVGSTANGYHPFVVEEISAAGNIGVSYLPDFSDEWNSEYEQSKNIHLEDLGGWDVKAETLGTTFRPYLSLYNSTRKNDNDLVLFYCSDFNANPEKFVVENNSGISDDKNYLTSKTKFSSGVFAVNTVLLDPNQPETEAIPKIVNFIVANSSGEQRLRFQVSKITSW